MLMINLMITITTLLIFFQDLLSRSVYWFLFPLLTGLFVIAVLNGNGVTNYLNSISANLLFLVIQFLAVTCYFSIKNRVFTNITTGLIGWGDLLFLISVAFYMSFLNFMFFYISSLILIVAGWLCYRAIAADNKIQIPLAGLQALLFTGLFIFAGFSHHVTLTNDTWLFKFVAV